MSTTRFRASCLLALLSAGLASPVKAAQANHAPAAASSEATALYRARQDWTVTSTIFLSATDEDPNDGSTRWTFTLLNPGQLRDASGSRLACTYPDPDNPGTTKRTMQPEEPIVTNVLRIECDYHPPVGFEGEDRFQYQVADNASPPGVSAPATVTVTVKAQGLRWEVVTSAGQTLSGNSLQSAGDALPDVIGGSTQDFLLRLDWLFRNPQHDEFEEDLGRTTFAGHFGFETGLVTRPESVIATPVTSATGQPSAGGTPEAAIAPRRKVTFAGEVNYNWVAPESPSGAFVEVGALARGALDADVDGAENFEQIGQRLVKLTRTNEGAGSYRVEAGGRVALKQYHAATTDQRRQRGPGTAIEYARNSDDFLAVEFGYRRDTSFDGAYFLRILATPVEIPGVPGHGKPLFGVEVTGGPGQATDVKLLYGANVSAIGKALGIGR